MMKRPANAALMKRPAGGWPQVPQAVMGQPRVIPIPGGPMLPQWESHFVALLDGALRPLIEGNMLTSSTTINVWADCGGMGTEMFALDAISRAMGERFGARFKVSLYLFCDKDKSCREAATACHDPKHVAENIYHRDLELGVVECVKCGGSHEIPRRGVDVYVCCFPCGPWSKNGKQLGFDDNNGKVCFQAIASIEFIQPSLYVMENVVAIGDKDSLGESDLAQIKSVMTQRLTGYNHIVIGGVGPSISGFPTIKNRTLLVGGLSQVCCCDSFLIASCVAI